jgi:hypothetical protein
MAIFHAPAWEMPSPKPATIASWPGWVFRRREIYPDAYGDGGLAIAGGGSRPVAIGFQSTGVSLQLYSSAGCSPAEPASASPVTGKQQLNLEPRRQSNALPKFTAGDAVQLAILVPIANRNVISTLRAGCHFHLAPTSSARKSDIMEEITSSRTYK